MKGQRLMGLSGDLRWIKFKWFKTGPAKERKKVHK